MLERVVSTYGGDVFIDFHGDNNLYVGSELQFLRRDELNHTKAQIIVIALDAWERLGQPSPERFAAALSQLAC